ncbi:hypothetical protein WJX79_002947 [Trebouxia sp. C0005]
MQQKQAGAWTLAIKLGVHKAEHRAMWNCEMCMMGIDKRSWILGPMYDMHTGQLLALLHAREYPIGPLNAEDPRGLLHNPPLLPARQDEQAHHKAGS